MKSDKTNWIVLHDELSDIWCELEHMKERWGFNDQVCNVLFCAQTLISTYDTGYVVPKCEIMIEDE